ncbi:MAG: hypothetical protein GX488_00710 [Clostridiales bacterium]|nr:hypothetical protein [Clostridiales bacterium]
MHEDKIVSVDKLNFTFEGGYEVDALTVSKTIENLVKVMSITANAEYPESEFRLSVSAVRPGSLEFYFNAIAESAKTLLSDDNVNYAKAILEILISLFTIKKFLKKERPKAVKEARDNIEIHDCNGNMLVAPKGANIYFTNVNIDASISSVISAARSSPGVSGISITAENTGEKISIPITDFEELSQPIEDISEQQKQFTYNRVDVLFIKKPDLLGDSMWVFQSDRQVIADIADEAFMKKIHSGEIKVFAGMSILADIQVRYDLLENGLPNEKTIKYTVLHVKSINVPGDGQMSIAE